MRESYLSWLWEILLSTDVFVKSDKTAAAVERISADLEKELPV